MSSPSAYDLAQAPLRRLQDVIHTIEANLTVDSTAVPDAVIHGVNDVYSLWESWCRRVIQKVAWADQNAQVRGDAEGETVAALCVARGGNTHDLVTFGEFLGFGSSPFGLGPFGRASWFWQPYSPTIKNAAIAERQGWYHDRVEKQSVLPVFQASERWLSREVAHLPR